MSILLTIFGESKIARYFLSLNMFLLKSKSLDKKKQLSEEMADPTDESQYGLQKILHAQKFQ